MLLDCRDGEEVRGYVVETFFLGGLGKCLIEFAAFDKLFMGCGGEVFGCCSDDTGIYAHGNRHAAALKIFEIYFCMSEFIGGCVQKYFLDGEIIFFFCLRGVEIVARHGS